MQIDGHHAMTYVAARLAGYEHPEASIIAHSAQYVDDATNEGTIKFTNGAMYKRISSAHKMVDYRNWDELSNHLVWVPFHFLPGNDGKSAGENVDGSFIRKLVCRPDSYVARDMLRECAKIKDRPYFLHGIGIAMHAYADTWAHQGFAGVNHAINEVSELESNNAEVDENFFGKIGNVFLSEAFPLGHGAALSHPDQPSLIWKYKNGLGQIVERSNPEIFIGAVDGMCRAMQCFRVSDTEINLEEMDGLPQADAEIIRFLIESITDRKGEGRHQKWLDEIKKGSFSFGAQELEYIGKGEGSWKHQAIGQLNAVDEDDEQFIYDEGFMNSNWKYFHDALQAYRFSVLHDVLPKYGICAA